MRAAALGLWLAAALPAAAADYQPDAPLETYTGARDFAFRCKGCHGFAGEGTPGHVRASTASSGSSLRSRAGASI